MLKRYGCAIAVALLAAGAGAGCGADDEEALSKAEYIKQGDAICKAASAELRKQLTEMFPGDEEPSGEELTNVIEDVFKPNIEGQLNDLRDLIPPKDDEETVNAIYEKVETGLAKLEDDPAVLLSTDDPLEPANKAAEAYGFKVCSE